MSIIDVDMNVTADERVSAEEIERRRVVLTQAELHDLTKTLFYAKNGFSVAFSGMFNFINSRTDNKEDAHASVDRLAVALKDSLDHVYSGDIKSTQVDGVLSTEFRPKTKISNNKLN